ncbi:MAG TPA: hypothetical protein VHC73_14780 [Vitreimonas sp.]|jgi:hypothetical protein|nr:hypothetical protein [Vitreimonas sp.]
MNAEEILAFADTLRAYALESSDDLNAANLFTHAMLMRRLLAERQAQDLRDWKLTIDDAA